MKPGSIAYVVWTKKGTPARGLRLVRVESLLGKAARVTFLHSGRTTMRAVRLLRPIEGYVVVGRDGWWHHWRQLEDALHVARQLGDRLLAVVEAETGEVIEG